MNLLNDIINRTMEKKKQIKHKLRDGELLAYLCTTEAKMFFRAHAELFGDIIGVDFDYFIGDTYKEDKEANRPTEPVEMCAFGDYYFNIHDVRTVVENMHYWLERYGSKEALAEEIFDWYDHIADTKTKDKDKVNLFHWLSGCPRPEKGGKDGSD